MKVCCQELDTPIGKLLVAASSSGICRICFPSESESDRAYWFDRYFSMAPLEGVEGALAEAMEQLLRYFQGRANTSLSAQNKGFECADTRSLIFKVRLSQAVNQGSRLTELPTNRMNPAIDDPEPHAPFQQLCGQTLAKAQQ